MSYPTTILPPLQLPFAEALRPSMAQLTASVAEALRPSMAQLTASVAEALRPSMAQLTASFAEVSRQILRQAVFPNTPNQVQSVLRQSAARIRRGRKRGPANPHLALQAVKEFLTGSKSQVQLSAQYHITDRQFRRWCKDCFTGEWEHWATWEQPLSESEKAAFRQLFRQARLTN